jgi:aromatic ring-opening dioxygenase catalytic subunit (LigB family)
MGEVLRGYFVPNGSYLMELAEDGVGGPSVEALQAIGREIRTELRPDAIVVASPHWQPKSGFFVDPGARHESFNDYVLRPAPFGRRFFSYTAPGDPALAQALIDAGRGAGLPVGAKTYGFDHGAFCPLKVMDVPDVPTVPISISQRSTTETLRWGEAIRRAVEASPRRVVVVAPGNLTHRLDLRAEGERDAFFAPGAEFDRRVIELVTSGRITELDRIDPELLRHAAPEAGNRPFFLLAGVAGRDARGRLLRYHGMRYSVGDATFAFDVAGPVAAR